MEVRELLSKYGFPGDDTPIVKGSSKPALDNPTDDTATKPIDELVKSLDEYVPIPEREVDKPFLIAGRGRVLDQGPRHGRPPAASSAARPRSATRPRIVGFVANKRTTITGIEQFQKTLDQAIAGDNVGVLLRGVEKDDIQRGQVICAPKSITPHRSSPARCTS
jgi:elongation factor Tu